MDAASLRSSSRGQPALAPRADFAALEQVRYLNQASLGLIPAPVLRRIAEYDRDHLGFGNHNLSDEAEVAILDEVRRQGAALFGVEPTDLAIVSGATEVIGQIAWSLRPTDAQNVVVVADDFPSTVYPWLRVAEETGASIRLVAAAEGGGDSGGANEPTLDRIIDRLDPDTAVVCVSQVMYHTGELIDATRLRAAADQVGAVVVLDITQSAGTLPVNLRELDPDFAVASGYKWLCGPGGAAVGYLSPTRQRDFRPAIPGWKGTPDPFDFDARAIKLADGARRIELSTTAYGAALGLGAGMEYLFTLGMDKVRNHSQVLFDQLFEGVEGLGGRPATSSDPCRHGAILTARFPGQDFGSLVSAMRQDGINVSTRGGGVRFSLAPYNDSSDIDAVLTSIEPRLT